MAKSTGRRLFEMLNDGYMTDITFVVQRTAIKGHRVVASSHGGVLKEVLNSQAKTFVIDVEISVDTFRTVLEFLYTDDCKVKLDNLSKLMDAAKRLQLKSLEHHCAQAKQNVALEAKALLKQTIDVEGDSKGYQEYFRTISFKIIESKEYLGFSKEVLAAFCGTDNMPCSQLELFLVCAEWAKRKCEHLGLEDTPKNMRSVVKDALAKINFKDIPRQDFLELVAPIGILTSEEVGKIVVGWGRRKDIFPRIKVRVYHCALIAGRYFDHNEDLELAVSPSTRISKLKERCKFNNGRHRFSPDTFTLGHRGKELQDDVTLASIYTPGEDLILTVHSMKLFVKLDTGKFPVTVKTDDLEPRCESIIKSHLYTYRNINPENVSILNLDWAEPGSDINVRISASCWITFLFYAIIFLWSITGSGILLACLGFFLMLKWIFFDIAPITRNHIEYIESLPDRFNSL